MKKVILIPYNPEDADGKSIEEWANFNLFRTGDRAILKNCEKGCRIVLYDTWRGVIAECKLVRIVDMRGKINDDSSKKIYNLLIRYPLYPFDLEDMTTSIREYPLHIFYNDFKVYNKVIPIREMEEFSHKDLRNQNGVLVEDVEGFDSFLTRFGAI